MESLMQNPALLIGLATVAVFVLAVIISDLADRRRNKDATMRPVLGQYRNTALKLWSVAAVCLVCWLIAGQPLAGLRWQAAQGWGGWVAWGLAAAAIAYAVYSIFATHLDRPTRIKLREDFARTEGLDLIRPATSAEHVGFQGIALTAGITEEIVFRGFLVATLAIAMPLWAAALVSMVVFIGAHAYQGLSGMVRILPITVIMTVVVLMSGSLWPAIIIHVVTDAMAGFLIAIVDRHEESDKQMSEPTGDDTALSA